MVEVNSAIICASLPACKPLLMRFYKGHRLSDGRNTRETAKGHGRNGHVEENSHEAPSPGFVTMPQAFGEYDLPNTDEEKG